MFAPAESYVELATIHLGGPVGRTRRLGANVGRRCLNRLPIKQRWEELTGFGMCEPNREDRIDQRFTQGVRQRYHEVLNSVSNLSSGHASS
jgi:hypothetical protein